MITVPEHNTVFHEINDNAFKQRWIACKYLTDSILEFDANSIIDIPFANGTSDVLNHILDVYTLKRMLSAKQRAGFN